MLPPGGVQGAWTQIASSWAWDNKQLVWLDEEVKSSGNSLKKKKKNLPPLPQKHIISKQCSYSKLGCQLPTGWFQPEESNII